MRADERWARVSQVLSRALDLSDTERAAFLAEAVLREPTLRTDVMALFEEMQGTEGFLETPALAMAEAAAAAPDAFGAYRVLGELGQGGMGIVYLAERSDGQFGRRVAVKRLGSVAPGVDLVRRFRDEREILARLDHPNIARLLDAGLDAGGVPYLVMEHVQGVPLTLHCRERKLGVPERLGLFLKVCAAVHHAHQHLVIHRDIKPGNILVTPEGEPKLLDFGIARILSATPQDDATRTLNRALTLDYASPEQLRGDAVTTGTDVYSLGVLLFQLLADEKPYELEGRSLTEALRLVCETVPPPPSTKAPAERRSQVAGDLDGIVGKALEKEPADRYGSVAELAADVAAYLGHVPVKARRPSFLYVGRKFVRRHRMGVLAGAAVGLSLVAGLGAAVRQARRADDERRRAEARFQDVRQLAAAVIYELHDAIANLPGATPARRTLVTRALQYLDRLAGEGREDLALQRELADAYQRVAQVQGGGVAANLGDTKGALDSFGKALAIRRDLAARRPADPQDTLAMALLQFELAAMQRAQGQAAQAEESYLSVATRLEAMLKEGVLPDGHRRVGSAYQRLAEAQAVQGKREAALQSAQHAVTESESAWRALPGDPATRSTLAASLHQLADALAAHGSYAEALAQTREGRRLLEATLPAKALDAQQTRILLFLLNGESHYLLELGDRPAALRVKERLLEVAEEAWRGDPRDRWSQMGYAIAAKRLGEALLEAGDTRGSVGRFRQALEVTRRAEAEDPHYRPAQMEVASAEAGLGRALLAQGRPESVAEGCAALRRVDSFWTGLRAKGELPPGETTELGSLPKWLARCPSRP